MILVLAGCVGQYPFLNEPPRLLSVNDVPWDAKLHYLQLPEVEPGGVLELEIVAEDPENDGFGVWFPQAYGTVDFDPDERSGSIQFPERQHVGYVDILLRDDRDPPVGDLFTVYLGQAGSSSYYGYGYGYGYTTYGSESGETGDTGS